MYQYIFFDLDGTLTDSRLGIIRSVQYALEKLRLPLPDEGTLLEFIGPPLQDSFMKYCGLDRETTLRAIALFQERYFPIGKYENAAAPGMPELCAQLQRAGYTLALASSKPEELCISICDRFGYTPSMAVITGSPLDESQGWTKEDVIRETCRRLHLTEQDAQRILMVGDRRFDVEGARLCGIDCVGVRFFGYAAPGELEAAGAVAVVDTAEALRDFIFAQPGSPAH